MSYYILADKGENLYFQEDGVLTSDLGEAKRMSHVEAEKKSLEFQLTGIPTTWIYSESDLI